MREHGCQKHDPTVSAKAAVDSITVWHHVACVLRLPAEIFHMCC